MRPALLPLLAASLFLLTALPVHAQATGDPFASDPTGDVTMTPYQGPTQKASGFDQVDLTGLWLSEDPDAFHFQVGLAKMDDQPLAGEVNANVFFTFDGTQFEVGLYRSQDNAAWFGSYYDLENGSTYYHYLGDLRPGFDTASGHVWVPVDRSLIVGSTGRTPGHADQFTDLFAVSYLTAGHYTSFANPFPPGSLLDVSDRLPDSGGLSFDVQYGGDHSMGPVSLHTDHPYHASNGGENTYVYDFAASNHDSKDRTFRLSTMDVPQGWNVTLPGDLVTLKAGAGTTFQVAVHTPFFHAHGSSQSFHLHLTDVADQGTWAMAQVGVHYLAIPQPAGHHDVLYLHTHPWSATADYVNPPLGGTTALLTMNTLEDDKDDAKVPDTAYTCVGGNECYGWAGCLNPGLAMGLDFDLSRTGSIRIPVSSEKPVQGAKLTGRLLIVPGKMEYCFPSEYNGRDVVELAKIAADGPVDVAANGAATLTATITPQAAGDRVPYQQDAQLVLELLVNADGVGIGGEGGLTLQPGGNLQLPLNEYQDAAPAFSAAPAGSAPAFAPESPKVAKKSPGVEPALLLGALALLAVARRRWV